MDKKKIIGVLLVSALLLMIYVGKKDTPTESKILIPADQTGDTTTEKTIAEMPLNELQAYACNNADLGGTCKSKLEELNVVQLADCCKYLNKCCV
jgi:hypothetical protein